VLATALRDFEEAGIELQDVGLRRPTLDDVFLSLTGHAAEMAEQETQNPATGKEVPSP
jgi:ABC-2 type transport system ATP-binding protein